MGDVMVLFAFASRCSRAAAALFALVATVASPANATLDPAHQFVTNGGFEQLTNGYGQVGYNTNLVGWTSTPLNGNSDNYSFVMNATNAQSGVNGQYGALSIYGPANGTANGLTASPTGGNFYAGDGAYEVGQLSQTLTGLIVGQSYQLTFNYAGAQQTGFDGATTESWYYGLASQSQQQTAVLNNVNHGFTGWQSATYNFVATQASDTLYFMAQGTPSGQPPFSLLDSVSLVGAYGTVSAAPDPSTWMLMLVGFGLVGYGLRRRRGESEGVAALRLAPAR